MKTDFDYIKEQFDKDGIKAPDSLSEDRIAAMLSSARDSSRDWEPSSTPGSTWEWISIMQNLCQKSMAKRLDSSSLSSVTRESTTR